VNTLLVRREAVGNASMDRISRLVRGMCQEGISALAFDQRDDGAPVSLADAGALQLFTTAQSAGTTVQSPQVWSNDDNWKHDFMNIANLSAAQIEKLKSEHEKTRAMKRKA